MSIVKPEAIYGYSDYRVFLADLLESTKEQNPHFSYRYFAEKAGFSSHSYLQKIIRGERMLTEESMLKMGRGFKFSKAIQKYFSVLVRYNQSVDPMEKNRWYTELLSNQNCVKSFQLDRAHLNYYENWYYPVLRHLSIYLDWKGSFEALAACVEPPISAQQAKKGIEDLIAMGLLEIDADGQYRTVNHSIRADKLPDFVKQKARLEIFQKSVESLSRFQPEDRYTSCSMISVNEKTYREILTLLQDVKEDVITRSLNDNAPERVYQMVLQVFPYSKKWTSKETK